MAFSKKALLDMEADGLTELDIAESILNAVAIYKTIRSPVSYTHLRAHETVLDLVCRLLLEKKNNTTYSA